MNNNSINTQTIKLSITFVLTRPVLGGGGSRGVLSRIFERIEKGFYKLRPLLFIHFQLAIIQSYSEPMVMLVSSETTVVLWYQIFVSTTTGTIENDSFNHQLSTLFHPLIIIIYSIILSADPLID